MSHFVSTSVNQVDCRNIPPDSAFAGIYQAIGVKGKVEAGVFTKTACTPAIVYI